VPDKRFAATVGILPRLGVIVVSLALAGASGCGSGDRPPLGTVHGRVTLDGQALPRACVGFAPKEGGHESTGLTDAAGDYELKYIRDIKGAKVGGHTVRISTAHDRAGNTETVPPRYNAQSILKADVAAGDNVLNFDLATK